MVQYFQITIPELTKDEPRTAYVYLPESYERDFEKRYPVLYMFDGHNVFFDSHATYGKSWGMKEYMDSSMTELIIAAVECNHDPDNGRLKEYTPFPFSDPKLGSVEAKGQITMDWLVHDFKEEIDRNYRTLPDPAHCFIAGSSMGGLMSLYALLAYPDFFSGAAALSPSLWVDPVKLKELIRDVKLPEGQILYLDFGEEELRYRPEMRDTFAQICALLLEKGILLHSRIVPGGTHCEASWERQIPFFMNTLLYQRQED